MTSQPTPELRAKLLGPVRLWAGTREVTLGSPLPRAVIAMLAMRTSTVVSREELIDGVWGENPPATVEGSLYTYVSSLRKALEPDRGRRDSSGLLASEGAGYRLQLAPDNLDVVRFDRLRQRSENQLAGGDPAGALRSVDEALSLWQGEALSGVTGPYALAQRSRLAELRVVARELRSEAALATGQHTTAVADIAALVHEYPIRERPRSLLMLALYRCGRQAEALAAFRDARQVLIDELGVEPGRELQELHERILANDPSLQLDDAPAISVRVPTPTTPPPTPALVGRDAEMDTLRTAVAEVSAGRGRTVWIEGEMGIGKSALLAAGLAHAQWAGCQVLHAVADTLGQRFPLRAMLDCLDVTPQSTDPRRVALAHSLREGEASQSIVGGGNSIFSTIDRLVALVEELCAGGPLAVGLDDVQWADESSLEVWHRLCQLTDKLPLLLVGVTRPAHQRPEVDQLRRDTESLGGAVLRLTPLDLDAVAGMVGKLIGAPPGPRLREIAGRAGGNPLYVREIADALMRERVVRVEADTAEVPAEAFERVPGSLVSAVTGRLGFLSEATREVLRWAALLGGEFGVVDLSVVVGKPVSSLVQPFEEAIAAGVLRDAGLRLAFRHPLIRQSLYEGTPSALRVALHYQAAQALADAGVPEEHVAEQLLAAEAGMGPWAAKWLAQAAPVLHHRAPLVVVELLQRVLETVSIDDARRAPLMAHLSRVLFRLGRDVDAEQWGRKALPHLKNADLAAEIRWVLAYVPYRASQPERALAMLEEALADTGLPQLWRARLMSLLALVQRAGVGEMQIAQVTAQRAVDLGEEVGDAFTVGQSLEVLWQVEAVRRDYARGVEFLNRAMDIVGTDISLTDLRLVLLDNRMFTLQCLDRLDEAGEDLRMAFELAGHSTPLAGLHVAGAVHRYWLGQWDEAQRDLAAALGDSPDFTGYGLREGGPVLLLHGVGALIAAHRDDVVRLDRHLDAGLNLPVVSEADRENCDFLVAAKAMAAARAGRLSDAIAELGIILDPRYEGMMLRHQWLPELVRMAIDNGDMATARDAAAACEAEAHRETTAARADAAAARCRAVINRDADALVPVAAHYRAVGRVFELAQTLEERAILLAAAGRRDEAEDVLATCLDLYRGFGAAWDIRRAEAAVCG
ncbi:BTAD domain-containing putative transcriptional regulator [Kutzneria sp. NPDC052558]|uniref:BTAD domain-containing putative transcriptional regulator n=1 Tax=Kutzneria sp. NPDC052558 TaxID=3364121 RepID=UPI0037C7029B